LTRSPISSLLESLTVNGKPVAPVGRYIQASTKIFEVEGFALDGKKVPRFITFPEVPGRESVALPPGPVPPTNDSYILA
jgi:hypothetical protein